MFNTSNLNVVFLRKKQNNSKQQLFFILLNVQLDTI